VVEVLLGRVGSVKMMRMVWKGLLDVQSYGLSEDNTRLGEIGSSHDQFSGNFVFMSTFNFHSIEQFFDFQYIHAFSNYS
jgi:hypothetical protein